MQIIKEKLDIDENYKYHLTEILFHTSLGLALLSNTGKHLPQGPLYYNSFALDADNLLAAVRQRMRLLSHLMAYIEGICQTPSVESNILIKRKKTQHYGVICVCS